MKAAAYRITGNNNVFLSELTNPFTMGAQKLFIEFRKILYLGSRLLLNRLFLRYWEQADIFFSSTLIHEDKVLKHTLRQSQKAGLPAISITPAQGKFLELITRIAGAKRILEVGTLGGYSTIWLARGMRKGGKLVTIEYNPTFANVAKKNIHSAGFSRQVEICTGKASDILKQMEKKKAVPFDLIFIDADKNNYPVYLAYALKFSHKGTIIIGDNMLLGGTVVEARVTNANLKGIRRYLKMLGSNSQLSATVIQTVGGKGYDGFSLALVQ